MEPGWNLVILICQFDECQVFVYPYVMLDLTKPLALVMKFETSCSKSEFMVWGSLGLSVPLFPSST